MVSVGIKLFVAAEIASFLIVPFMHAANAQNNTDLAPTIDTGVKLVKQVGVLLTQLASAASRWLEIRTGYTFEKVARLAGDIILWFLQLMVQIVQWLIRALV